MTRTIPLNRYRNIGILASPDAGRTTTTERLLAAASSRDLPSATLPASELAAAGRLPAWAEQDNERDITQTSAATSCFWRDYRINIVELPPAGRLRDHGLLAVLDGAVLVIDGTAGLTPAVAAALDQAEAHGLPCLVFVNKLDREAADLSAIVAALSSRGRGRAVLLQLPIGAGAGLSGLVDPIDGRTTIWAPGHDAPGTDGAVPPEMSASTAAARAEIAAAVAGGEVLDDPALRARLHEAVSGGQIIPVLCGSAFRNRGIRRLLDAIVDYLPAPSEMVLRLQAADGKAIERPASDDEPFAGLAFQTVQDPAAGKLTFLRVYSGVVATGEKMLNSAKSSRERIGRMMRMHANHAEEITEARAGDIVALTGLTHTTTGDTLCDPAAPVSWSGSRRRPAA
jgi:elongation factor G